MKYLPGPHQTIHQNYYKIVSFLQNEITKHQEEWNPDDPRDYIDTFLAEMKKVRHLKECSKKIIAIVANCFCKSHVASRRDGRGFEPAYDAVINLYHTYAFFLAYICMLQRIYVHFL